ncbi:MULTISPECIES: hypothetical protein [Pantoea]|uniref:Uncharacterized protein n=1 Tax=Candidatus Pantoea multigeneris TaxID=2608357 RepID=A0ABX0RG34_9GAMM|nr:MULTISPECIES: hypothetical protein [Pantoea]NIF24012.1 hypothetical protein [Pantoea multigeneris]
MKGKVAEQFAESMAFSILENDSVSHDLIGSVMLFFRCIDGGEKYKAYCDYNSLNVITPTEKFVFYDVDRPQIEILKEVFYTLYFSPKIQLL